MWSIWDTEKIFTNSKATKMEKEDKNNILYAIDGLIKSVKLENIAAL
jgi:hypothetical protein